MHNIFIWEMQIFVDAWKVLLNLNNIFKFEICF